MIIFKVKKGEEESEEVNRIEMGHALSYNKYSSKSTLDNPLISAEHFGLVVWHDKAGKLRKDVLPEVELSIFINGKFVKI